MTDTVEPTQDSPSGLSTAPEHIKLAVDLIVLLEENKVDTNTALLALDIVKADLNSKLSAT